MGILVYDGLLTVLLFGALMLVGIMIGEVRFRLSSGYWRGF
jgi:hypothetical protein